MSNRNKLIISIVVIVVFVIVTIILTSIKKKQNQGQQPTTGAEKISDIKTLWPKITPDQKTVYYFNNEKEPAFFQFDLDMKETKQISEVLDTPDSVLWSPDFSKAILFITYDKYVFEKYGSPFVNPETADQTPTKWVYDFTNKKLSQLSSNITNILWLDNDHIIYGYLNNNVSTIYKALYDGSEWQKLINLETTFIDKFIAFVDTKLYFLGTPGEGIRNLYTYDITNNKIDEKIKDVGESALISPDNSKIVLEQSKDNKTTLYWSNIDSPNLTSTGQKSRVAQSLWLDQNRFLIDLKKNNQDQLSVYDTSNNKGEIQLDLGKLPIDLGSLQIIDKNLFFTSDGILYRYELKNL